MKTIRLPVWLCAFGFSAGCNAPTSPLSAVQAPGVDNKEEPPRLPREDQAVRTLAKAQEIDWAEVRPRDATRRARVKAIDRDDGCGTELTITMRRGCCRGLHPENSLLAYALCVVAISKGESRAKWLSAGIPGNASGFSSTRPRNFGNDAITFIREK